MKRHGAVLRAALCAGSGALLVAALPATAQVLPTRPQAEPPAALDRAPPPPTAQIDSAQVDQAADCPLGQSVRVTLTGIAFEAPAGGPVPPAIAAALADIAVPTAPDQPISVVCTIRDQANAALRDAGFVASVQIPAQEIAGGTLRLVVVAARLVEVRVIGDAGPFRRAIEARAEALKALDPLNRREAERQLLLAGDIPGLQMSLTLKPAGRAPGEVIGELNVVTQQFVLLANVQNYGSRQLGREIGSVRGELYGLTGLADRTFVSLSNAFQWDETHVIQGGHDFGIGANGLRVGARASYALSNPDIENLELRSRSLIAGLDISYPLIRSLGSDLRASGGFELLNQRTVLRQGGIEGAFTRDRLRIAFARLDGRTRFLSGSGREVMRIDAFAQVRKGLNIFDASERFTGEDGFQPSRFDGDPQATVISGELRQLVRPFDLFSLEGSVFGQWANRPLLNLEEFSIGNLTYGRGYDPGSNGADRVIAARVEPRVRLPFATDRFALELTGFYDWVRVYNLDPGSLENDRTLRSYGGGVRLTLPGAVELDVTYAKPLDFALQTDVEKPRDRVLVSLTVKLLPWGTRR